MILRKVRLVLIAGLSFLLLAPKHAVFPDLLRLVLLSSVVYAQDLSKTVFPVGEFKLKLKPKIPIARPTGLAALAPEIIPGVEVDFGTGFCLDPDCRFIGTNYHVAVLNWPRKIKGHEVIARYLATGPDDEGATWNDVFSKKPMKYTLIRDLAIFELRYPLPHHSGIKFNSDDLEIGQEVDVYGYPKKLTKPAHSLVQVHGIYEGKTREGFLVFDCKFSDGKSLGGGASGGLVLDSKTHEVVGVLRGGTKGQNGKQVALAIPIQSLTNFVNKVQPWIAQSLFPSAKRETISPTSLDLYPKFVEPPPTGSLEHRPEEPTEVEVLREKAQLLVDSMKNYIAIQTVAWGSQKNEAPVATAEYEVRVIDGVQRYREYPDGRKEFDELPLTLVKVGIGTGGEWANLPRMVGKIPKRKIHQLPDAVVAGHRIKVFHYRAEVEDDVCGIHEITDFLLFQTHKVVTTPCRGEVWTDEEANILRISENDEQMELYGAKFKNCQALVTYGWLRRGSEAPRLIPLTIARECILGKKLYWCRGIFKNYQIFTTQTKIGQPNAVPELPH